jgi:hypothetical protein
MVIAPGENRDLADGKNEAVAHLHVVVPRDVRRHDQPPNERESQRRAQ